jgi:hypothetical protein
MGRVFYHYGRNVGKQDRKNLIKGGNTYITPLIQHFDRYKILPKTKKGVEIIDKANKVVNRFHPFVHRAFKYSPGMQRQIDNSYNNRNAIMRDARLLVRPW